MNSFNYFNAIQRINLFFHLAIIKSLYFGVLCHLYKHLLQTVNTSSMSQTLTYNVIPQTPQMGDSNESTSNILPKSSSCPSRSTKKQQIHFDNFIIHREICQAKFSVYLVSYAPTNEFYAMKVYPHDQNRPSFFFLNEIRFAKFLHPNIVSMAGHQANKYFSMNNQKVSLSYVVMEFAPYGDMFDLLTSQRNLFDEKLSRTYFHQLIEGLSFLHLNGVCHLDIKLENLLIGDDFILKIADFDLSYMRGDNKVHALGSKYYRAPEIISRTCVNPQAADIYSAGIVLFMLCSKGVLPHLEEELYQGVNLFEILKSDEELFWSKHCEFLRDRAELYTPDFKELFIGMTKTNPTDRFTIDDITKSRWYQGAVYTSDELINKMEELV